jgi:hypothetical protein
MALSRPGPIVSAVSGTIGSLTFHSGKRGGIIAAARTRAPRQTEAQIHRQTWFTALRAEWEALEGNHQKAWKDFANSFAVANRLGIPRRWSPAIAYITYRMLSDPARTLTATYVSPPRASTTPPPSRLDFVANTSTETYLLYNYTLPYSPTYFPLYLSRRENHGPRRGAGQVIFLGVLELEDNITDLYNLFEAASQLMPGGELYTIRGYNMSTNAWDSTDRYWPSPPMSDQGMAYPLG